MKLAHVLTPPYITSNACKARYWRHHVFVLRRYGYSSSLLLFEQTVLDVLVVLALLFATVETATQEREGKHEEDDEGVIYTYRGEME